HTSILDFYCQRYPHSASPQGWLNRIGNGQVTLNGIQVTDPATPLSPSDCLCYHRTPWQEPPAPCHFTVLFQDSHVLVLSKPSGLQVLRGAPFHQRTLLSLLALHARNRLVPVPLPATEVEAAELAEGTATDRVPSAAEGVAAARGAESNGARAADSACASQQSAEGTATGVAAAAAAAAAAKSAVSNGISARGKAKLAADLAAATTSADAAADPSHAPHFISHTVLSICGITPVAKANLAAEIAAATSDAAAHPSHRSPSQPPHRALVQGVVVPDEQTVQVPIGRVRYGAVVGGLYMASPTGVCCAHHASTTPSPPSQSSSPHPTPSPSHPHPLPNPIHTTPHFQPRPNPLPTHPHPYPPVPSPVSIASTCMSLSLTTHVQAQSHVRQIVFRRIPPSHYTPSQQASSECAACAASAHAHQPDLARGAHILWCAYSLVAHIKSAFTVLPLVIPSLVSDPLYVSGGITAPVTGSLPQQHSPNSPHHTPVLSRLKGLPLLPHSFQVTLSTSLEAFQPLPGDTGYWLHSFRCLFHHPTSNQVIRVVAPPPPALRMPHETVASFLSAFQVMPPDAMMDLWHC
ncbi:unnamed protein product, partial [Closterium sp. NIES-65]